MVKLFDTHAHLNDEAYKDDLTCVIKNCRDAGLEYIVNVGYDEKSSGDAVELADEYDFMYAVVGAHPDACNIECDLGFVEKLAQNKKVVALGEIGLDYHYDTTVKDMQKKYFIEQISLANRLDLPVTIHNRDADMDMLEILKKYKVKNGFIMHCFSSSLEVAKEVLKLGGYISFAGPVTFKNASRLIEVAKAVPDEKILIETDCPYLAPEPNRGGRNDPSQVFYTLQRLAQIRETTIEKLGEITLNNAKRFYNII